MFGALPTFLHINCVCVFFSLAATAAVVVVIVCRLFRKIEASNKAKLYYSG